MNVDIHTDKYTDEDLVYKALAATLDSWLARPSGSFVTKAGKRISDGNTIRKMLVDCNWECAQEEAQALKVTFASCRYFKAKLPHEILFKGFVGAMLLKDYVDYCQKNNLVEGLNVVINAAQSRKWVGDACHQDELVSPLISPVQTNEVWLIVGVAGDPFDTLTLDNATVYTWHPGAPFPHGAACVKLGSVDASDWID